MAFDLNKKKEENKKFNLTKSEDSLSDLNSTNEKKDDKSESDVKRSKFDLTKDSTVLKNRFLRAVMVRRNLSLFG